jgi:UDP-N-acetylmuramate--alanine ligase
MLDDVILLPIYPAREEPIAGVSSKMLLHKINKMDKYCVDKEQLLPLLSALQPELLVTLGAGDIDKLVEPITNMLKDNE